MGSAADNQKHIEYLNYFIETSKVKTVFEIGCGDFTASKYINFENITYLCAEMVDEIVERNTKKFGIPDKVRFVSVDDNWKETLKEEKYHADLIIIKGVLMNFNKEKT